MVNVLGAYIKKADTSDEDSVVDNASTITALSDNRSQSDDIIEEEEASVEEIFEEKLKEAIDGLTLKSAQSRINSLTAISVALTKKLVPDFISDRLLLRLGDCLTKFVTLYFRKLTLTDALEKSLKKGRGKEQEIAAQLAMLMCFQLSELAVDVKNDLCPIFQVLSRDASVLTGARAKFCSALGLITFIAEGDGDDDVLQLMQSLEAIFSGSYLKGNGVTPVLTADEQSLHAAALSAWSLLLTLISPYDVFSSMTSSNDKSYRNLPYVSFL